MPMTDVIDFIHETSWDDLPGNVRDHALVCLSDLIATATAF